MTLKSISSILLLSLIALTSCSSESETQSPELVLNQETLSLTGIGTEPFWAFRYNEGVFVWQEPGESGVISTQIPMERSYLEESNTLLLNGGSLSLNIMPGECSDGMSDRVYEYTVNLDKSGEIMTGCATSQNISGE